MGNGRAVGGRPGNDPFGRWAALVVGGHESDPGLLAVIPVQGVVRLARPAAVEQGDAEAGLGRVSVDVVLDDPQPAVRAAIEADRTADIGCLEYWAAVDQADFLHELWLGGERRRE